MSFFQYLISYLLEAIAYILYAIAVGLYLLKVKQEIKYKALVVYFNIGFLLLLRILTVRGGNNFYYSLLYVVNSIGWGIYFYHLFNNRLKKFTAIGVGLLTILYFSLQNLILKPERNFDSLGYVISSSGIVILVFLYLHQVLSNVRGGSLSMNFDFWIICSQLIYNLGAFGIFLTYNHFTTRYTSSSYNNFENQILLTSLWGLHNVLLFLASLLTWVGALWIVYREKEKRWVP